MADFRIPLDEATHQAARRFMQVTTPLLALAISATVARVVMKTRSALPFRWDDRLIVIGCSFAAADWAVLCSAIVWCTDSSISFASGPVTQRVVKLGTLGAVLWAACILCVKLSVVLTLNNFVQKRVWRLLLKFTVTIVILNGIMLFLFPLVQCLPLAAAWDPSVTGAKCMGPRNFRTVSNCGGFINMATDLILSLYPLTFLYQLRRPVIEKVLIFLLMATGITASAASIVKMLYVTAWEHATMTFSIGFNISMLTCVEICIGITAACLPGLSSTIYGALAWCGAVQGRFTIARPSFVATPPIGTTNDQHGLVTLHQGSMNPSDYGMMLESTVIGANVSMSVCNLEEKRAQSSRSEGSSSREAGDHV